VSYRIVLASWGSYGDLFPSLGIAARLKSLGHTPVIASCPYYRALVEGEGFLFHGLRPDVDPARADIIKRVMDPQRGPEVVIKELVAPAVRDAYADLQEACRGADLLVSHPVTFAAPILAEKTGLPWVSTVLAPLSFFSVTDFPVLPNAPGLTRRLRTLGPWAPRLAMKLARRITHGWTAPVRAFRAELGLPPAGDPLYDGQFSPHGTLALFSRVLAEPQPDWPRAAEVTGFPFFNGAIPMPTELSEFLDAGEPPITFTLGTSAVGSAGTFYEESVKAVRALERRAVLLVGGDARNRPRDPLPAGVMAVELAPHDALFPRSAAVVHQGGIGTTGQALRAGRPTLVVPHAHDQPDNAFRSARTGGARVCYPTQYKAERVASDLRTLLDDPSYLELARATAKTVSAEDGAGTAAGAILKILATERHIRG
jgi:rhamnosyltransferase subunit B